MLNTRFPKILIILFLLLLPLKVYALTNVTVDYPEEILIEKGWMGYADCIVNNTGDIDIHNVVVSVEGSYNWLEFQKSTADIITVSNATEFITKIYVPNETSIGSYNFSLELKSDEISIEKDFTVIVFETRDDLLLYQVRNLRSNLNDLKIEAGEVETTGKNVTFIRDILNQIKAKLDLSEEQITEKMYNNVTENIREAEKLFIMAEFELSNPSRSEETKPFLDINLSSNELLIFSSVGIILSLVALTYLVRKIKIQNKVRVPNLKVKELVVDNQKLKDLEQEIEKIRESQRMIEGEYRDNIISKESYDELRSKYQEKLLGLETEIKKVRGY